MQSPVELPIQNACKAYDQGDYKTAYRLFKLLSEQGNADAQSFLGIMYFEGQGVSQDYVETAMWYRKAAEQGLASAQYALGHMYEYGKGIPQEHPQVAKWFGKVTDHELAGGQNNFGLSNADSREPNSYAEKAVIQILDSADVQAEGKVNPKHRAAYERYLEHDERIEEILRRHQWK